MPRRYILILGTFFLSMLLYVDRACISAAKAPMAEDLGFSDRQMGWVLSAFALAYALGQTPGGVLADRFGPRIVLTMVATVWSLFTALTGVVRSLYAMVAVRFFFGLGEAGAYPTTARAFFTWLPLRERGLAHGFNFSGGRIGAAVSFPLAVLMISTMGWQAMYWLLGALGIVIAVAWYVFFRDDPEQHPAVSEEERRYIAEHRQPTKAAASDAAEDSSFSARRMLSSVNVWLLMTQYICSNFTFFFMLSWSFTYLRETYDLTPRQTALYNMVPLFCGALGNWVAGVVIDRLYAREQWVLSRRLPAIVGFVLAAVGVAVSVHMDTPGGAVIWIAVAIFGADMTLSPSWSTCNDVGQQHSGTVSGTMNMAGNLGSFLTALAFPYLNELTGSHVPFFYLAAALNVFAIVCWFGIRPDRALQEY